MRTGIHEAVEQGNLEQVETILRENPEFVHFRDEDGMTLLHILLECGGNFEMADLLIKSGADINISDALMRQTPIFWAILNGRIDVIELLLSGGAQLNVMDIKGHTPLRWAQACEEDEIADLILKQMERA